MEKIESMQTQGDALIAEECRRQIRQTAGRTHFRKHHRTLTEDGERNDRCLLPTSSASAHSSVWKATQ